MKRQNEQSPASRIAELEKELEIEASLERVRAKTMSMHNSDDVADTVLTMFAELVKLGVDPAVRTGIGIIHDISNFEVWAASAQDDGRVTLDIGSLDMTTHPLLENVYAGWKNKEIVVSHGLVGEEIMSYFKAINDAPDYNFTFPLDNLPEKWYNDAFFFPEGCLFVFNTEPLPAEASHFFKRFAGVFGLTYRRFLDLQKAEGQARESQIEVALERVRSRSMAMQKSEELRDVIQVIFNQFTHLNFNVNNAGFAMDYKATNDADLWMADANDEYPTKVHIPYLDIAGFKNMKEAKDKGLDLCTFSLTFVEKNKWMDHVLKYLPGVSGQTKTAVYSCPGLTHSMVYMRNIALYIQNLSNMPFTDAENAILKRFGKVFEQTYTRFNDLKQAEAQARESQIQLALERVRARTMAMQKSEELAETASVLFQQLLNLGISSERTFIGMPNDATRKIELWGTQQGGNQMSTRFEYEADATYAFREIYKAWQEKRSELTVILKGKNLDEHLNYVGNVLHMPLLVELVQKQRILYNAFFSKGLLMIVTPHTQSKETLEILERFAGVFDGTYTRFLDLQKAEGQARESQIQLALERVRARTMAMQKSDELREVVALLFTQLDDLGFESHHCVIGLKENNSSNLTFWISGHEQDILPQSYQVPHFDHPIQHHLFDMINKGIPYVVIEISGEEKPRYDQLFFTLTDFKNAPELVKQTMMGFKSTMLSCACMRNSFLQVGGIEQLSDAHAGILQRFATVFEQTYTRFNDLKNAEEQAREARIEAGLERVRAKAMAMHSSADLAETIGSFYHELGLLSVTPKRCGMGLIDKETRITDISTMNTTEQGDSIEVVGSISLTVHPVLMGIYDNWLLQKEYHPILRGNEIKAYYQLLRPQISYPDYPNDVVQYGYFFYFQDGGVFAWTDTALPEDELQIYRRFNSVLSLTYRRYKDIKDAEAQAREAKIETALERVRAVAMSMRTSDELLGVCESVYAQLNELGFTDLRDAQVYIRYDEEREFMNYSFSDYHGTEVVKVGYDSHPRTNLLYNNIAKAGDAFVEHDIAGDDLKEWKAYLEKSINQKLDNKLQKATELYYYLYSIGSGAFGVSMFRLINDEERAVLKRFRNVFDLSYKRYSDIALAEAQAREAKIETALERVRSKTMAMHNSQDVGDTIAVMFDEFVKLGIETIRCGIFIGGDTHEMEVWTAKSNPDGVATLIIGRLDTMIHPLLQGGHSAWKNKASTFEYRMIGDDLKGYYRAINKANNYRVQFDIDSLPAKQFYTDFFFADGAVFAFTVEPIADSAVQIFKRFAGVFGQTYRRYLDLKRAEAQSREAQIEVALEKVRSKAMAMHNSNDMSTAVSMVFTELKKLGIRPIRCGVGLFTKEAPRSLLYTATISNDSDTLDLVGWVEMVGHPVLEKIYESWLKQEDYFPVLNGKELKAYYKKLSHGLLIPSIPDGTSDEKQYGHFLPYPEGMLNAWAERPYSEPELKILDRFKSIISLTFRRYHDLKKAEEAAREAQIEASLERVRGKAMAMRNSGDLSAAASTVFTELRNLGINPIRSGVGLLSKDTHKAKLYSNTSSSAAGHLSLMGEIDLSRHPVFEQQYQSWLTQENYFVALGGKELAAYYKILSAGLNADLNISVKKNREEYGYWFMFSEGFLYAWSDKEYTDAEIKILERFKNVIELTFRRYIELQKSEAQARDAVRQASLDRVRAEIASMRTVGDLDRITPLIWNELTILGVPFIRCGVFIMDEPLQVIHTYLSTPDGKAIAAFQLHFSNDTGNGVNGAALRGWREKQMVTLHWTEEEFRNFSHSLVEQGEIISEEGYLTERLPTGLDLHFFPFLQGMLYAGNTAPLSDDDKDLVQSLADAFSTAYARYEDFYSLELAKHEVERTLNDLKTAQTRLVQSEKMASLGELTAGIAHEIQNPLNFVNNFSEVNQEMIDELEEELNAGNIEEALAIAADIKQNEQKINHHGKRADGIVKGMLQHSRTGGGEKLPTNINSVAEEYMRLSYHGLRAKDKVFNAEMVMNFDPDLPRVEAVGQDIGRVFLNLFNNAFYAVNQKKKDVGAGYNPEVSVSTSTDDGHVIVKVKDNGIGMPDSVKEKIMQPFFTTKPTGEGTGLGLSLTYDMVVKGHGGTITVTSKEGEGSEFTISLPIN